MQQQIINLLLRAKPTITLLPPVLPFRRVWGQNNSIDPISIPKIIWMYWNADSLPFSVQIAIDTIRKNANGYNIRLISDHDLPNLGIDVTHIKDRFSVQSISDYIRLQLLKKYGGIWMDATIYLTKPIAQIFDFDSGAEFYGFYSDKLTSNDDRPVVENYFMAARPNASFIVDWLNEYEKCLESPKADCYYADFLNDCQKAQNIGLDAVYLKTYVSGMYLMYHNAMYNLSLVKAGDMAHFYTYAFHEKKMDIWNAFFINKRPERIPDLIKITGPWRQAIDAIYDTGMYRKDALIFSLSEGNQYCNKRNNQIVKYLGRKLKLMK